MLHDRYCAVNVQFLKNLGSINTQLVFSITRSMDLVLHGKHMSKSKIFIGPKHEIQNVIRSFLQGNFTQSREHLNRFKACGHKSVGALHPKDRVFCYAYNTFLSKLLEDEWDRKPEPKLNKSVEEIIAKTVIEYVKRFADQNKAHNHDLFFLNVPTPTYNKQLDTTRNAELVNTICLFNAALEK